MTVEGKHTGRIGRVSQCTSIKDSLSFTTQSMGFNTNGQETLDKLCGQGRFGGSLYDQSNLYRGHSNDMILSKLTNKKADMLHKDFS